VMHTGFFLFYVIGLVAASWHFAYGIWLFCAKWGIVSGAKAQQRLLRVSLAFFLLLCAVGFWSLYSFRSRPMQEEGSGGTVVHSSQPDSSHQASSGKSGEQAASYGRPR